MSEPLAERWGRRALTFSVVGLGWALWIAALPLLPVLAVADALRRARLAWSRAFLTTGVALTAELVGLAYAGVVWVTGPLLGAARTRRALHRLQSRWGRGLFGALRRIYGLRLEIVGRPQLPPDRPVVVLSRHVSVIDSLLPVVLLPRRQPRYVLKRELLWDPCLDVVGQRVPTVFVRRGAADTAAQLDALRGLAGSRA